jgi:hypothetical protein
MEVNMRKTLKIVLIVVGSLVGVALVLGAGFVIGKAITEKQTASVDAPGLGFGRGAGRMGIPFGGRVNVLRGGPGMMGGRPGGGIGRMGSRGQPGTGIGQPGVGCVQPGVGCVQPGLNSADTLTLEQAKTAVDNYVNALNNTDLFVKEIMVFDNGAYAVVVEKSTGIGTMELLVDPGTLAVYAEHGPNMMWNLKYGHMREGSPRSGMMGGISEVDPNTPMTVTTEQAVQNAQKFLDGNLAGSIAADDPIQFYGYYTLDFEKDGKVVGMISVNGFTGQTWLHTWHGTFVEEKMY